MTKHVSPTGSYSLELPSEISEDYDGTVASYWKEGQPLLLQMSSYSRSTGQQTSARDRLMARLERERLSNVLSENIPITSCPESAAASGYDEQGCRWTYCYAVWPDLTVFASISGQTPELGEQSKWAFRALESMERSAPNQASTAV